MKNDSNLLKQNISGMINEIKIKGMSCHFSYDVVDCESYWKLLKEDCYVSRGIPCGR